ncbi:MAG: hypothetical protein ACSHW0_07430 [Thalassotalea sp.]
MNSKKWGYLAGLFLSGITSQALAADVNIQLLGKAASLADLVVYLQPNLQGGEQSSLPINNKKVEIGQQHKSFTPYISVMQLGSDVAFTNQDDITHHIYSPIGNNKFDFKIRAGEQKIKQDFVEVGEVAMGCNIHDWMSGYLLILPTPYFEKTDQAGQANIIAVENGQYQLTVWHPQLKTPAHKIVKTVMINKNERFQIDISDLLAEIPEQKSDEDFDFLDDY